MAERSDWKRFPDPDACGFLVAPFGPGVYELRNAKTGQKVLFGRGRRCATRMGSLLPDGGGTRNNEAKRTYLLKHLAEIEYRTRAFATEAEMVAFESGLRDEGGYLFGT
jgi:hypothetical protein